MGKREEFLKIFRKAQRKYAGSKKRLAGEGWKKPWQVVIVTIMSAQSRDETTIPIAEKLFSKYGSVGSLAKAKKSDVLRIFKGLNYNKTKAKHVVEAAKMIKKEFKGKVPDEIDDLVKLPGVGRKTANLVITEVHKKPGITVDTHVHRISNVFGFVKTKTPHQTELALMKLAPRKYWGRINRTFVLWGKDVPGRDKKRFLKKLEER